MALYWLDVSNISRRAAPGTLQAHGNYVLRESARQHVVAVNFPNNKHAIKRELAAYEEWAEGHTRKDARLVYKIMHALPRELGRKGQIEATRRFLWELTMKGRGRGFAAFHDLDTDNPHVHIVFIDRDENGKSVALLSASKGDRAAKGLEPNSTEWLRQLWELECNGVLAEHGLDVRIDRRTNLERGLAAAAEQHRGWKADAEEVPEIGIPISDEKQDVNQLYADSVQVDPAPECPPMPVDAPEADEYPEPSETPPDEDEMVEKLAPREAVIVASEFLTELRGLQDLRAALESQETTLKTAQTQLATAEQESTEAFGRRSTAQKQLEDAKARLEAFQREDGSLKGAAIKIGFGRWKTEFKTATRKRGEQALATAEALLSTLERATIAEKNANDQLERWEGQKSRAAESVANTRNAVEQTLSQYGQHATLESAEGILSHTAHAYLDGVTVEDLADLYEGQLISTSQYRDALELMGRDDLAEELDETAVEDLDERVERGLEN